MSIIYVTSCLKALADHMGGKYHKSDGKIVLEISQKELEVYFGEV